MNGFEVYIHARELDYKLFSERGELDKLRELDHSIREDIGRLYRLLDSIDARAAELAGPAVLPRPRNQTDKQRRVSKCPRCGGKE